MVTVPLTVPVAADAADELGAAELLGAAEELGAADELLDAGGGAFVGSAVGLAHATATNANAISASKTIFFISSPPKLVIGSW